MFCEWNALLLFDSKRLQFKDEDSPEISKTKSQMNLIRTASLHPHQEKLSLLLTARGTTAFTKAITAVCLGGWKQSTSDWLRPTTSHSSPCKMSRSGWHFFVQQTNKKKILPYSVSAHCLQEPVWIWPNDLKGPNTLAGIPFCCMLWFHVLNTKLMQTVY